MFTLFLFMGKAVFSQDFSNKGKEFYLCFPSHVPSGGSLAEMYIFITSDKASSGVITYNGQTQNFVVNPNSVTTVPINRFAAYINDAESGMIVNKGIRVKVDDGKPAVVVYTQIYAAARTAATLVLPTSVLGRKYQSINYYQAGGGRSQFNIIAVEPNTTVQIQRRENGNFIGTFNVNLPNVGDVYQVQSNNDLTGTYIESIATATEPCKKIAVFSGSSTTTINSQNCSGSSSDPLFQQCYPVTSWGKNFGVVPILGNNGFQVRVMASEDNTNIVYRGVPVTLNTGQVYPAIASNQMIETQPFFISADKPISVSQYLLSQNCAGGQGDPDMIILNPIEQNISDITIFTSTRQNISAQFVNVLIPTAGTASFRINGNPVGGFTPMPTNPQFSYLRHQFPSGDNSYTLTADSGFNAICYGLGNVETYGYSAGTNVRDLYQYVSVDNGFAEVDFPATCKGTTFQLSMTFPYEPAQIRWIFNGLFPDETLNSPVYDETSVVNGKTLYKYILPGTYTINNAGSYPIRIIAQSTSTDGCNGEQEIDYEINVYEMPVPNFNFNSSGCVSNPVSFTDNSTLNGRPATHWHWNFGDGATVDDVTSTSHSYSGPGAYDVKYTLINDIGCKGDTVTKTVILNDPPVADFSSAGPYCAGRSVSFTDLSSVPAGSTIAKWTWNFGDGSPAVVANSNAAQNHTFASAGTFTVTLLVETAGGCQSAVFSRQVAVSVNPVADFNFPSVICLPSGAAQFNDLSSANGGAALNTWAWNFGDGGNAAVQNPLHNFTGTGPYNVSLTVTSTAGCSNVISKNVNTIFPEPQAAFVGPTQVCVGSVFGFTNNSTAGGSTVSQWNWDFGDGNTSTSQNPVHSYTAQGSYTVTLNVTSAVGCPTVNHVATSTVVVNPLPTANFNVSLPGCVTRNVGFTDASAANAGSLIKWTWNFGDGNTLVANSAAPLNHIYTNTGTYNVTVEVESDNGCKITSVPQPVVINVLPVSAFISPEICQNDMLAPLTDNSTISTGSISSWQWNFNDPNANAGNPNTSSLQNPTHHFTQPGTYSVQLVTTSDAGCTDTLRQDVLVNGVATAAFNTQNNSICSNRNLDLVDASTITAGKILRTEIYWDISDPTIRTVDNNPVAGRTYTHQYPEFASPATRTVTVRYDVYSGITCISSVTRDITLHATPQIAFAAALPVCSNSPQFQLSQGPLVTNLTGTGAFSGAGVSQGGLFNPSTAGAGTHVITYTFTADNGCVNAATQSLVVNPTPVANAGPDKVVLEGGVVTLTPTLITSIPVTYSWSPPTWLDDATIAQPASSPQADITYTLTVTSDKGCMTSDDVFVKMLKAPEIPNVFTPNRDGINDTWVIRYLESYPGCTVEVFNRYGQLIFRSIGYSHPWDGTFNGKEAPAGTYYYIVDPKNGRQKMSGFVDIVR